MMKMKLDLGGLKGGNPGFKSVNIDGFGDVEHNLNEFPYPFRDNTIDEVIMSHIIEHLESPLKVMEEIWRICKSGALVHIRIPARRDTVLYNPYHLHDFKPEWFDNLNPSSAVVFKGRQVIKTNLNFKVLKKNFIRGSIKFWKKHELYVLLSVVKN